MESAGSGNHSREPQFFWFHDPLSNSAFRGKAEPPAYDLMLRAMRGAQVTAPIPIQYSSGRVLADFIWVPLVPIVHVRVIDILRRARITGWTTFPVDVRGSAGEKISDYVGFGVTGRCEHVTVDAAHSELIYKQRGQHKIPYYRGIYFPQESWDGSDFFTGSTDETAFILATETVNELIRRECVKNCRLDPVTVAEFDAF